MKTNPQISTFVLGAFSMLAIGCFIGASSSSAISVQQYDASFGLAGLQIVDHEKNTIYIYKEDRATKSTLKLWGSVDLTNAGKQELMLKQTDNSDEK